ncbi:MAG TPA: S53 family peptidase [Gaiellales bacterium]|nr:S53 family peptidase [Gaiellales bacterium]
MSPRLPRTLPVLALCALAGLLSSPAADAQSSVPVADTQPFWASPTNLTGADSNADTVVFSVWLGWSHQAELNRRLSDLYDPASSDYHRWLSPNAFHARFAPTTDAVRMVETWLESDGFDVVDVPANRLFVTAEGPVATVEQAFQVHENLYRVDGAVIRAPNQDPVVPAQVAPLVRAITGLDGAMALARPNVYTPPPPPAGTSVGPCSRYWGEKTSTAFTNPYAAAPLPWLVCGYVPSQIDSAYGVDQLHGAGLDGRGQTIAVTGAFFSPTIRSDANYFSHEFGLPGLHSSNYREIVAPGTRRFPRDPAETQSWYIEQALDVEWAHAIAPRAKIVYVGAANDARGLDLALNYAVDHRVANIVSNSWGLPEALVSRGEIRAMNDVFEQAAAQGMGVYFASGDDGDNVDVAGKPSAGFPDSSPWVTSVGGTSLAVGDHGQYLWESAWGTASTDWSHGRWAPAAPGPFLYGSGGGPSHVFPMPGYQAAEVPPADATWKGQLRRTEPDLALVADPQTGVTFSQTYVLPSGRRQIIDSWIGGTSLSAPLLAGIMALADQKASQPHGFINPTLYLMRGTGALRDVRGGHRSTAVLRNALVNGHIITRLRSFDRDSSLAAAAGWDPVTGLGSPNGPAFLAALG